MSWLDRLELDGYVLREGVLDATEKCALVDLTDASARSEAGRGGVRNLLQLRGIRDLAGCGTVRQLVEPVLGPAAFPVRGILFDKTDGANWKVPWHQDVTIAVKERVEIEGFGPWSAKAGVLHVQPPADVLEGMLTVRIHLDDCFAENGALRVLPGTHQFGKIPEREVGRWAEQVPEAICEVGAGGVLLMRPLLVHSSSAATRIGHRRVIHLDYSGAELPSGLEWAQSRFDPAR